jgi:aspartate/glutamate racemase
MDSYKLINEGVNKELSGLNLQNILFAGKFCGYTRKKWGNSFEFLLNVCKSLKRNGVDSMVPIPHTYWQMKFKKIQARFSYFFH